MATIGDLAVSEFLQPSSSAIQGSTLDPQNAFLPSSKVQQLLAETHSHIYSMSTKMILPT